MNVFCLLRALQDCIIAGMMPLSLPSRQRQDRQAVTWRQPDVFIGALPLEKTDPLESVPFVLVQALDGYEEEGEGLHIVQVAFRLAVQDAEPEAAENHLHNLLSLVRQSVMRARAGGALDGRFLMRPDERRRLWYWRRPDEQFPPFAEAYALTNWAMKGIE